MDRILSIELMLLLLIIASSAFIGTQANEIRQTYYQVFGNKVVTITECNNLTLEKTANCFVAYVTPFYKYKIREDIPQSLNQLKINGGDCYDWSLLYTNMAKEIGLNAEQVQMQIDGSNYHAIAVITDKTGYCVLDQLTTPNCHTLAILTGDEQK